MEKRNLSGQARLRTNVNKAPATGGGCEVAIGIQPHQAITEAAGDVQTPVRSCNSICWFPQLGMDTQGTFIIADRVSVADFCPNQPRRRLHATDAVILGDYQIVCRVRKTIPWMCHRVAICRDSVTVES